MTPNVRRRLYEASIAACAIAVGYGLMTSEQALLWVGLAAPVIGIARANVTDDA